MDHQSQPDENQRELDELRLNRDRLERELGTSDAEAITQMVRSLEAQLADLYATWGDRMPLEPDRIEDVIEHVRQLSTSLDAMFAAKSLTIEYDNGKPRLRANWHAEPDPGGNP